MDKDCSEIQELLSGYLDHILSDEEEFEVEVHLAHCESCRDELHALMKINDVLTELKPVKAPEDFLAAVKSKIEASVSEAVEETAKQDIAQETTIPAVKSDIVAEEKVSEEKIEATQEEEKVLPEVMTPQDMSAEEEIDISPNKTIQALDNIINFIAGAAKKRSYQAGFGLALAGVCLMVFIQNSGMDKPVEMMASSDTSFTRPAAKSYEAEPETSPVKVSLDTRDTADTFAFAKNAESFESTAYFSESKKVVSSVDKAILSGSSVSWDAPQAQTYSVVEGGLDIKGDAALQGIAINARTLAKDTAQDVIMSVGVEEELELAQDSLQVGKTEPILKEERSYASVLDSMTRADTALSDNYNYKSHQLSSDGNSYSDIGRYSYSDAVDELDSSASTALSAIEKEVLKSAISRADDELRAEYGYKDYFSKESLTGITVDDSELEDPMTISIANDRNMIYISADDPAHIVNMLRDKSAQMWLDEPIVNASELPYVVSFYVSGTIMERLLDECREAGASEIHMSFRFEADDYDQNALYYLQIDK